MARFYRLVRLIPDLFVLRVRTDRSKDVEILVLRHQLSVLQRQIARPRFEPDNQAIITALSRAFGRDRWSIFMGQARHDLALASTTRREPLDLPAPARTTLHHRRNPPHDPASCAENATWGYRLMHGELAVDPPMRQRRGLGERSLLS